MSARLTSVELHEIIAGETLPINLYLFIDGRFILFRAQGDLIDLHAYQRLESNKVRFLFCHTEDVPHFQTWRDILTTDPASPPAKDPAPIQALREAREDAGRQMMDIFASDHPDQIVRVAVGASKKLVAEMMRAPLAVQSLSQLQTFSTGTVHHSINVAVLSVYLAMQMGYDNATILQHIALGSLLHDVGKMRATVLDTDPPEIAQQKLRAHPTLGAEFLQGVEPAVPKEVLMILEQHHEMHDGSGFPKRLRGNAIYDLARIVALANTFDELVIDSTGPIRQRQKTAVKELDQRYFARFEPDKFSKSMRILQQGV